MRLAFAALLGTVLFVGCKTQRASGDELPPTAPTQGQEPVQEVPAEPPGPAAPLPEVPADAGTTDAGTTNPSP